MSNNKIERIEHPVDPRLLSESATCELGGFSPSTLRNRVREGLVHPYRIAGRCTLYDRREIEALKEGAR